MLNKEWGHCGFDQTFKLKKKLQKNFVEFITLEIKNERAFSIKYAALATFECINHKSIAKYDAPIYKSPANSDKLTCLLSGLLRLASLNKSTSLD